MIFLLELIQEITLYLGKGNEIPDGVNGDLIVRVRVQPHSKFNRDGKDIFYDHDVSMIDAALGCEIIVPTIRGNIYTIRNFISFPRCSVVNLNTIPGGISNVKVLEPFFFPCPLHSLHGVSIIDPWPLKGDQFVAVTIVVNPMLRVCLTCP